MYEYIHNCSTSHTIGIVMEKLCGKLRFPWDFLIWHNFFYYASIKGHTYTVYKDSKIRDTIFWQGNFLQTICKNNVNALISIIFHKVWQAALCVKSSRAVFHLLNCCQVNILRAWCYFYLDFYFISIFSMFVWYLQFLL